MAALGRKKISISILIPFLLFVLLFSGMIWLKYRSSHEAPNSTPEQKVDGSRSVILFFAAEGQWLARETREIEPCENESVCLKGVLDELLKGPVGEFEETVPEGTVVNSIRIESNQATIEFNRTFSEAMQPGSSTEMLAVYSVVNSVAVNFPLIEKVKLNIEGNKEALLHHIDLSEPLVPDYSLEQPATASSKNSNIRSSGKSVDKGQ